MCPLVCALQILSDGWYCVPMHVAAAIRMCITRPRCPAGQREPSAIAAHSNRCRRNGATTAASHLRGTFRVACPSIMSADELTNYDDRDEHDGDCKVSRLEWRRSWRLAAERARLEWIERRAILQQTQVRFIRKACHCPGPRTLHQGGVARLARARRRQSPYVPSDPKPTTGIEASGWGGEYGSPAGRKDDHGKNTSACPWVGVAPCPATRARRTRYGSTPRPSRAWHTCTCARDAPDHPHSRL